MSSTYELDNHGDEGVDKEAVNNIRLGAVFTNLDLKASCPDPDSL